MSKVSNETIIQLFSNIHSIEATKLVQDMIRIPTVNPPGEEGKLAEYLAAKMNKIGLEVELYDCVSGRPNVTGRLNGKKSSCTFMLNGHLDTVPEGNTNLWTVNPFGGEIREGRIYGRGSADMKGGLAAMLLAAKSLKESSISLKGDLLLTFVIDEEVSGLGAINLIQRGCKADMAIVAEPSNLHPVIAHKGLIFFEISTIGKALHASGVSSRSKAGEVNAIYKMANVTKCLQQYLMELEKKFDPLVGSPTVSVGTIIGGSKTNMVPDKCTITVDRRLLTDEHPDQVKVEIEEFLHSCVNRDPTIQIELKTILSREGVSIDREEPIVRYSKEAVKYVLGTDVEVSGSPVTSDMAFFVKKARIPTIMLGPGMISKAHATNEYIDVEQIVDAAKMFSLLAVKILG